MMTQAERASFQGMQRNSERNYKEKQDAEAAQKQAEAERDAAKEALVKLAIDTASIVAENFVLKTKISGLEDAIDKAITGGRRELR